MPRRRVDMYAPVPAVPYLASDGPNMDVIGGVNALRDGNDTTGIFWHQHEVGPFEEFRSPFAAALVYGINAVANSNDPSGTPRADWSDLVVTPTGGSGPPTLVLRAGGAGPDYEDLTVGLIVLQVNPGAPPTHIESHFFTAPAGMEAPNGGVRVPTGPAQLIEMQHFAGIDWVALAAGSPDYVIGWDGSQFQPNRTVYTDFSNDLGRGGGRGSAYGSFVTEAWLEFEQGAYVEATAPGATHIPAGEVGSVTSLQEITVYAEEPLTVSLLGSGLAAEAPADSLLRVTLYRVGSSPQYRNFESVSPTAPNRYSYAGIPGEWSPGNLPGGAVSSYFERSLTDLDTSAVFTPIIGGAGENEYVVILEAESAVGGTPYYDVNAQLNIHVLPARGLVRPLRQKQRDDQLRRGSSKQRSTRQGSRGTYW